MLWPIPADLHSKRIGTMGKRGPASGYKPEYGRLARRFCMLGATNDDLAGLFEVHRNTIGKWLSEVPEFKEAVRDGKMIADADVAEKLYERATGYSHPDVKFMRGPDGLVEMPYTKHYPPETAAAIFWLRNRRREQW